MTTAAEWLASTSVSRQVLVTISNIRETLTDWAQVGATTAYSVTWLSQTHAGDPRSAYRAITGVMINEDALTARASLAAVQANASSWFWDSATNTLYVSSSTGSSPSAFTWTGATFELYFSTTSIADDVLYEPRVVGTLPTLQQEEYDLTLGVSSSSSGALSLNNADGFFDDLAWRYAWHNATAAIRVGGGDMALSDYLDVGQLQIAGAPAPADDICTFQLRAFDGQARNRAFPLNTYDDSAATLPDKMQTFQLGGYAPMFFGSVADMPAIPVGEHVGAMGVHYYYLFFVDLLLDTATVATSVRAINRATGVSTTVAVSGTDAYGFAEINSDLYPQDTYDFTVTARRSTAATVGSIAAELLALCGVPASSLDTAAFAAADVAWPATMGLYVPGGAAPEVFVSCGELLRQLEQSSLGRIYLGADGLWTIDIYDPSVPLAASEIREELMTSFAPTSTIQEAMTQQMRVQYGHAITADTWSTVSASENAKAYQYQTTENITLTTVLTDAHYATLLAGRLAWMNSLPTTRVVLDGPPVCFTLKPRDKVRVIRQRGPGPTGSWSDPGVGMEVEAVAARPSDCRSEITIGNMRGIGGAVKVAAPNGTPNWASASSLERLIYGFALDNSTERADPSDASTFQQNRAW